MPTERIERETRVFKWSAAPGALSVGGWLYGHRTIPKFHQIHLKISNTLSIEKIFVFVGYIARREKSK
jgi:hypothetical protein